MGCEESAAPTAGGPYSFLPTGKHGQLVFFEWVTLTEHKWVILAERRGISRNAVNRINPVTQPILAASLDATAPQR